MNIFGSIVALVNPMTDCGQIDNLKLQQLIQWHLQNGTHGFVINGTTGESATVTEDEQDSILAFALEVVDNKLPVIAGTGTYSTATTIANTNRAKELGADAALVVVPYYNKPTQEGLYEHYKKIAIETDFPIILYNNPARTIVDLSDEVTVELSKIDNIIGIKDATADISRLDFLTKNCASGFKFLSGDDSTGYEFLKHGGHGIISVSANILPNLMANFCDMAIKQDWEQAFALNKKLMPLHDILGVEPNPIPCKWALHELGKIESGIRLPLLPLDMKYRSQLSAVLQQADLIS